MTTNPISALKWFDDRRAPGDLGVGGASLIRLQAVTEKRGQLTVGELGSGLPFAPRRFFVVSRVPDTDIRGEHAHRKLQQVLVCLTGSVIADVNDGARSRSVMLDCPQVGLLVPPMVWGAQHHYSPDAMLLVLASREYDASDSIDDFSEFIALRARRGFA